MNDENNLDEQNIENITSDLSDTDILDVTDILIQLEKTNEHLDNFERLQPLLEMGINRLELVFFTLLCCLAVMLFMVVRRLAK